MSDTRRVDQAYGDLDEHFGRDQMAELLQTFAYSSADQLAARPNPTTLPINGDLYKNLATYRAAITSYRRFCEAGDHPDGRLSSLDREAILSAIAACDAAGSVQAFVGDLEDRGVPQKYWLLHGGKRYPSKAIVHWAMREQGIEASAGGSLCKAALEELGFVVVDWPELDRARQDFLRRMDGFTSFAESSGAYWETERRYKDELIARAHDIAIGDGDDRAAGEALYRLLSVGGQGLPLSWRTLSEANAAAPELKDRFFAAIGALARSEAPASEIIAETAREFEALRDAGIAGLRRGEVAAIPITVWATLHPAEASWFKISKIEAMGKRFFGRRLFAQPEFREADLEEWLQLMRALLALMDREWGWQPRDLFDVQGFIWVALDERFDSEGQGEGLDPTPVWLVTSLWGDEDGTQRFIEREEWSLLYDSDSANNRRVREMRVGDRIFLKDFIPRAADLPFDAGGGVVTANRIRAAGTVTEASEDGLRVGVKWEPLDEPRTWYFYTNNSVVWRLKDPAEQHPSADHLRRFLLDGEEQEFPTPPLHVRRRIVERHAAKARLPLTSDDISRLADLPAPPALIGSAVKGAKATGGGAAEALAIGEGLVTAIQRRPPAMMSLPPVYDPALALADTDLDALAARLCGASDRGWSLLLSGPSGTGKSAFARHLAERAGLELIEKRGSDLLGMYVGQTEANMARAFRDAARGGAMLLIDEADDFLSDRRDAVRGWERSMVNEMLRQMETLKAPFAATTNLADRLDPATQRRFTMRANFLALDTRRAAAQFYRWFGFALPHGEALHGATPGDFAVVARRAELLGETDSRKLLSWLRAETEMRGQSNVVMGFAA